MSKVKSITGKIIERSNAIKIRDSYHEKNVDCFKINDKWVSSHFNNIGFDVATNSYNFNSKLKPVLIENTADFRVTSVGLSSIVYEEASFHLYDKDDKNEFFALDKKQFDTLDLKLCKISNNYYPKGNSPHKKVLKYNKDVHDFKYAISLSKALSAGISDELIDKYGLRSKTFRKTGKLNYTFGIEIETSGGVIPKNVANGNLNIDYIYDGSVISKSGEKYGGGEVVTSVLTGDNGIKHLKEISDVIAERCIVNPTCGVHAHIGGFKPTDEFVVNAYILGYLLQNDIFTYLPKKRRMQLDYEGNITGNNNPYCKLLPEIEIYDIKEAISSKEYGTAINATYKDIFKVISGGHAISDKFNKLSNHPQGHKCGYDKNSSRYCWLNLVPTIFNTRKNKTYTLEFRPFPETMDFTKIYYWLLFCMAFTKFCETYTANIFRNKDDNNQPLSVEFIIQKIYGNCQLTNDLLKYFIARKTYFSINHQALEENFKDYKKIECV